MKDKKEMSEYLFWLILVGIILIYNLLEPIVESYISK